MKGDIERAIYSLETLGKASFICNLELDASIFKEMYPDKHHILPPELIKHLESSIELYPLYGGGIDSNGVFNIIVALKSPMMKIEIEQENFEYKMKLKKRLEED